MHHQQVPGAPRALQMLGEALCAWNGWLASRTCCLSPMLICSLKSFPHEFVKIADRG